MLNLSDPPLSTEPFESYKSYKYIKKRTSRYFARWIAVIFIIGFFIFFLPWTQNIRTKGKLTTLSPDHRPQSIYATISGRIEKWYILEGQLVKKGDTIAYLSEVKSEYFDPQLLERTQEQLKAKKSSLSSYEGKAQALAEQIEALQQAKEFKLKQNQNKIQQYTLKVSTDSADLQAIKKEFDIAQAQYKRTDTLYQQGIKSLTEVEEKRRKLQEVQAKVISYENKLATTKTELANSKMDLNAITAEYNDKLAKAESDRFTSLSALYDAQGAIAKMENQYANYEVREQFYYIVAPQDCYISKILKKGLGEVVKENEPIVSIMPAEFGDIAVELYIKPMDYPLVEIGQKVRFIFDGWPAFVFSGWEGQSLGTFGGIVKAIDNMASENNAYRILVSQDPDDRPWPKALRVGSGAEGYIMLNDVPIWYEIWRQLNGFPPDFYEEGSSEEAKLKAPVKSLKK